MHLRDFYFAYNTAHHSSIGTSPALLNLGRELTPTNFLPARKAKVESRDPAEYSEKMKATACVVVRMAAQNVVAKLAPKFHDLFRIKNWISSAVYELANLDSTSAGKVHIKDFKPYHIPNPLPTLAALDGVHTNGRQGPPKGPR